LRGARVFFKQSDASFVRELFRAIPEQQRIPVGLEMDGFDVLELVVEFQDSLARAER
jgi:hypothetical protein